MKNMLLIFLFLWTLLISVKYASPSPQRILLSSPPSSTTENTNDATATSAPTDTATNTKNSTTGKTPSRPGLNMTSSLPKSPPPNTANTNATSNVSYPCNCPDNQTVSLLGRADYCLPPAADLSLTCGNKGVGLKGLCPTQGAMPCQKQQGHVLMKDATCVLDNEVYKCVADKQDVDYAKKHDSKSTKSSSGDEDTSTSTSTDTDKNTKNAGSYVHIMYYPFQILFYCILPLYVLNCL